MMPFVFFSTKMVLVISVRNTSTNTQKHKHKAATPNDAICFLQPKNGGSCASHTYILILTLCLLITSSSIYTKLREMFSQFWKSIFWDTLYMTMFPFHGFSKWHAQTITQVQLLELGLWVRSKSV